MKRVIRLHFKPILYMKFTMYDNYNVTTWPMETVTTFLWWYFFNRNARASKTLAHKEVLIPPIYYRYTSFPNCVNFQLYLDILGAMLIFENVKNLLGEVKIFSVFGHNFFLLPSIFSKFRMQSWFEILFIRHNSQLLLSSSFWENATVTTCPCGCPCNN